MAQSLTSFPPGTIVLAKMKKTGKHWPAMTVSLHSCGLTSANPNEICVYWFGDHRTSLLPYTFISSFEIGIGKLLEEHNVPTLKRGIIEALKLYAERTGASNTMSDEALINWATHGLPTLRNDLDCSEIPSTVRVYLDAQKQRLTHGYMSKLQNLKKKNHNNVEKRKYSYKDKATCMACFHDHVEHQHPIFTGSLCHECMEEYKETFFLKGDDGVKFCCYVCGKYGRLLICSSIKCLSTYCEKCLHVFLGKNMFNILASRPKWECFVCSSDQCANLRARSDWKERVTYLFWNKTEKIDYPIPPKKKVVVVLSVTNGLTGIFNVRKLNFIKVKKIYQSYVGNPLTKITSSDKNVILTNYPVKIDDLDELDMLIGGPGSLNDDWHGVCDNEGNYHLCAEFYRLLTIGLTQNPELFWAFECPATIPHGLQQCLTRWFSCEPKVFDTNWKNNLTRYRLWWGNFQMDEKLFQNSLILP